MAKYDWYRVLKRPNEDSDLRKQISVLFEDGDDVQQVIEAANAILYADTPQQEESLASQLLELPEDDFRVLLIQVWTEQMNAKGIQAAVLYRTNLQSDAVEAYNSRP